MRALAFACTSALTLLALFAAELAGSGGSPRSPEALAYLAAATALVGLAAGALRAVLVTVERPLPARWAPLGSALVLSALAAAPLYNIAHDLASGPGVQRLLGAAATPALFAAALGLVLALWGWHRLVLADEGAPRARAVVGGLAALGLSLSAPLGHAMHAELRAYAPLVDLGLASFAVLAGTPLALLLVKGLGGRPWLARGLASAWLLGVGAAGAWLVLAPSALVDGRLDVVPMSPLVARVDRAIFAPVRTASLLRDPAGVRCPPVRAPRPQAPASAKNLLLLSIDTLRSDALSWQVDGEPLAPNLRAFADASIYAPAAVSPYPATIFAMSAAFTGLSPSRLLFSAEPTPTVVSRAAVLADTSVALLPTSRWFEERAVDKLIVDGLPTRRQTTAARMVEALMGTLREARNADKSYVLWGHFFEPHAPYDVHSGFDFGDSPRARYQSEVAYLDGQLGRLFRFLESMGAFEDTLVVVFSDHGEALGERDYTGHHVYLDDFIGDVPLMVRAPGHAPREVHGVVALADVAATIADYVGLAQTPGSEGLSLLERDPPADRAVVAEAFPVRGHDLFELAGTPIESVASLDARMHRVHASATRYAPKVALVTADYRLIVDRDSGLEELFSRGGRRVDDREQRAWMSARLVRWHRDTSTAIYCDLQEAMASRSRSEAAQP